MVETKMSKISGDLKYEKVYTLDDIGEKVLKLGRLGLSYEQIIFYL